MSRDHVSALTLSHFRSHRLTRLALDGRPVVLFGANGAGKTNVLEAVSLLSPGRGLRRAGPDDIARRPEALGWKVAATLVCAGRPHAVETRAEPGAARSLRIDDKPAPQAALGRLLRMLWLVPAMDRLWTEGAEGRRRFLDRITLSFDPDHGEAVLAYEKAMRERNRLLREGVTDRAWYGALEAQMAEAGARIARARAAAVARLEQAAAGADSAFPVAELALIDPEGAAPLADAAAIAAALSEGRQRDMAAGRSLTGPHRTDLAGRYRLRDMPAAQCSTGEQKALLVSVVLANARALAEDAGTAPVLLLDEIAAHLDAGRRAALYDEICALDCQAWLTGTGAELFAGLGGRAQMFEVGETGGASRLTECEG